jgi:hypothetical protein
MLVAGMKYQNERESLAMAMMNNGQQSDEEQEKLSIQVRICNN